jgi:hypothetical protein
MSLNYMRVDINKPKHVQIVHQQMNMLSKLKIYKYWTSSLYLKNFMFTIEVLNKYKNSHNRKNSISLWKRY